MSRDLFKGPGNSPNYFTLGFSVFFTHPTDVFPGLRASSLLRPPPIAPPKVEGRSARVLREIINALKGYTIHIRDETHRNELLRDVRYYNFRGLEQQLIRHNIYYNHLALKHEIAIGLSDIRPDGASFRPIGDSDLSQGWGWISIKEIAQDDARRPSPSLVVYKRPSVEEEPRDLIIATGTEDLCVCIWPHVIFMGESATRLYRLFASMGRLEHIHNECSRRLRVSVCIDGDSSVVLDGNDWKYDPNSTKHLRIHKGLWRIRLDFEEFENQQVIQPTLYAVKLLATWSQRATNARKEFL